MPNSRRNTLIRTVAAVCGDLAAGIALASACAWIIEFAALGLFLSFLLWLVGILAALAVSQHLVHPTVTTLLSDCKLDLTVDAVLSLAGVAQGAGAQVVEGITECATSMFAALKAACRPA